MTDDESKDAIRQMREVIALSDRMIQESLCDPDLASKSDDYKQGYTHAFTEATLAFLAWRNKQPKP